jgi:hypothetical protein
MSTSDIISLIDAEIATFQQARALIAPIAKSQYTTVTIVKPRKKPKFSPEALQRIAEGQHRRCSHESSTRLNGKVIAEKLRGSYI